MIARYTLSTGLAGAVTIALLMLMSQLILTGRPVLYDAGPTRWTPYVVERREPSPVETRRNKPERAEPAEPPTAPAVDPGDRGTTRIGPRDPARPKIDRSLSGPRAGIADGDLLPIVKVQPVYPVGAVRLGLEGYVIVEFSVNRAGNVEDVRVVESSNRLFDQAAIEAAERFRYRPRVIAGEPIRVSGIRHVLRFEMDSDGRR